MAAFKMFDMNGDGLITKEELMQVMKTMGDKVSEKDATQMIKDVDVDKDGKVNYQEFIQMMTSD